LTILRIESETTMRLLALAVAAAFTMIAVSGAEAQPPRKRGQPVYVVSAPRGTVVTTRDESGRTRTRILVEKRSYLDGGTEVMPSDNIDAYRSSFLRTPPGSITNNTAFDRQSQDWSGDPFFLAGKRNPYPWTGD
jgi:hypothetical protein